MATNFGTKIDYNSALVKDNCTLFAPAPLYAAATLYSVAMGHRPMPRSTGRISSSKYCDHKLFAVMVILK